MVVAVGATIASAGAFAIAMGQTAIIATTVGGISSVAGTVVVTSGGAVGSAGVTTIAGIGTCLGIGPIGWGILGASGDDNGSLTWDCWKQIVRDKSTKPSKGITIGELRQHPNFGKFIEPFVVENIWKERFDIQYILLPNEMIAMHATRQF